MKSLNLESLNFKQFSAKIQTYSAESFSTPIQEIPFKLIPAIENANETFCFLESANNSLRKGRYSILAFGEHFSFSGIKILDEIKVAIRELSHILNPNLPMIGSLFGFLPYNLVREIEPSIHCGETKLIPEGMIFLPKNLVVIENETHLVHIVSIFVEKDNIAQIFEKIQNPEHIQEIQSESNVNLTGNFHENLGFYSNITKEDYCQMVKKSISYIKKGDIFQIVPSIRFYKEYSKHPTEFYNKLKEINPSPYMFYFSSSYDGERYNLIGASPEMLINCKENEITLRPLAGTIKRGTTDLEDDTNAKILLSDAKEISEHLMLLDLGRNDVGKVSSKVFVEKQMEIEKYSHVMHISSTVKGVKSPEVDMVDILKSGLPAGTLSGSPKIRAMQIISEIEDISRDFYAGTVGYVSSEILQTCIVLRSALIKSGVVYTQSGAGVVYDSIPEKEYEECIQKATAIATAIIKASL